MILGLSNAVRCLMKKQFSKFSDGIKGGRCED